MLLANIDEVLVRPQWRLGLDRNRNQGVVLCGFIIPLEEKLIGCFIAWWEGAMGDVVAG